MDERALKRWAPACLCPCIGPEDIGEEKGTFLLRHLIDWDTVSNLCDEYWLYTDLPPLEKGVPGRRGSHILATVLFG